MKRNYLKLIPILGGLVGYFILHPISMLIVAKGFNLEYLTNAFSLKHISMATYFSILGFTIGVVVFLLQNRLLNQKLKIINQNELLKQSISEKEALTRILVHDLANPIGVSKNFLELLIEDYKSFSESEINEINLLAIDSLSQACSLIEVSRKLIAIESGKIEMELTECNISEIIKEVGDSWRARCFKKELSIKYDFHDLTSMLKIEPIIFRHTIVGNLFSNAIKFSEPKETINIATRRKKGNIEIKIKNTGIGIEPDKLDSIFSETHKTTTLGTSGEKGTGFGLPLVNKFVKLMGGEISVESKHLSNQPNLSVTSFNIELPIIKQKTETHKL